MPLSLLKVEFPPFLLCIFSVFFCLALCICLAEYRHDDSTAIYERAVFLLRQLSHIAGRKRDDMDATMPVHCNDRRHNDESVISPLPIII